MAVCRPEDVPDPALALTLALALLLVLAQELVLARRLRLTQDLVLSTLNPCVHIPILVL